MDQQDLTPDEITQQLAGMLQLFGQSQQAALEELAAQQEQRAARLQQVENRIAPVLGDDNPRVVALHQEQLRVSALQRSLSDNATRASRLPQLKSYEWMVYGHVQDGDGTPVTGVVVRLFDKDRKLDDLLGYTTSDEFGDFSLVFHERTFYEPGENAPELYLMVEDSAGNTLYSSKDNVRYQSGRIEYFLIVLENTPPANSTARPK